MTSQCASVGRIVACMVLRIPLEDSNDVCRTANRNNRGSFEIPGQTEAQIAATAIFEHVEGLFLVCSDTSDPSSFLPSQEWHTAQLTVHSRILSMAQANNQLVSASGC